MEMTDDRPEDSIIVNDAALDSYLKELNQRRAQERIKRK